MTIQAVREWPTETRLVNRMVRPGTPSLFLDTDLNFAIKPIYRECKVSLNISLRFKSFSEARQWRAIAERRMNAHITDELHELSYHYPLPMEVLNAICDVYDRRFNWENPAPETLREYLDRCMTRRATTVVNQAGNNETVVISEIMTRVVGSPEFINGDINEPDPEQNRGTHVISLQYTFVYSAVDGVVMTVPQVVHNKLMPESLILPMTKLYPDQERLEQMDTTRYFLDKVTSNQNPSLDRNAQDMRCIYPTWDEFLPAYINPNHAICVSVLILFNTEQPANESRDLLKLTELGNWEFKDYAIAYLLENYSYVTTDQNDVFYINVYKDNLPELRTGCTVLPDLTVQLNSDPDYKSTYRIVVSVFFDLGILPKTALERLRNHYDLTMALFNLLCKEFMKGWVPKELNNGAMAIDDFNRVIRYLTGKRYIPALTLNGIIPLVSLNHIINDKSKRY
jgi:hypothetical protein